MSVETEAINVDIANALKKLTARPGEAVQHYTSDMIQLLNEFEQANQREVSKIDGVMMLAKKISEAPKDTKIDVTEIILKMANVLDYIRENRSGVLPSIQILRNRLQQEHALGEQLVEDAMNIENTAHLFVELIKCQMTFIKKAEDVKKEYEKEYGKLTGTMEQKYADTNVKYTGVFVKKGDTKIKDIFDTKAEV